MLAEAEPFTPNRRVVVDPIIFRLQVYCHSDNFNGWTRLAGMERLCDRRMYDFLLYLCACFFGLLAAAKHLPHVKLIFLAERLFGLDELLRLLLKDVIEIFFF